MQWFQNAFTRRINSRHRLWGHLFGGRYKAIPVEDEGSSPRGQVVWRDYLRTVIDYVHLNPARSGLVDGAEKSVRDYSWCSIAHAYSVSPGKRPAWMAVAEGLDLFGEPDTVGGAEEVRGTARWLRAGRVGRSVDGGGSFLVEKVRAWLVLGF